VFDEEHNRYELLLKDQKDNGFHFKFNWELLTLPEFQRLLKLDQELDELNRPFFLVGDEKSKTRIETKEKLVEYLVDKARKGTIIQRYKGLGSRKKEFS